jgi:DNA segregation ATPase FtsK/SpoIIIE, S-DNA-T family
MGSELTVSELVQICLRETEEPTWEKLKPDKKIPIVQAKDSVKFHSIIFQFTDWLSNDQLASKILNENQLWKILFDRFASAWLEELVKNARQSQALDFSSRFRLFCNRLIGLKYRLPDCESWGNLFVTKEYPLSGIPIVCSNGTVLLSGRIDAVRRHPEHSLEIVDYKLSRGHQQIHDMLQLAIYSAMLDSAKPGLGFCGTLEYYLNSVEAVEILPKELASIFRLMVLPILEDRLKNTAGHAKRRAKIEEKKEPPSVPPKTWSDEVSKKIEACLSAFGLNVKVMKKQEAPQVVRYYLHPDAGVSVASIVNRSADIQVAVALKQIPLIAPGPGYVKLDIPREPAQPVDWSSLGKSHSIQEHPSVLAFPIGIGVDGILLMADLADANMAHVLVAGVSGSGKSEFLKSMLAAMIYRASPDILKISVIDPKYLTFTGFSGCKHLTGPVIKDIQEAVGCLEKAVQEMEERYILLAREGLQKLSQRIAQGNTDLPYWVIVFDEFADLVLTGKENKKKFEDLVARLAGKGRAAGIHLVLATQRPDKDVVTGLIKANLPLKICLRVTSKINSQIVLGQNGGEALLGKGDLLCDMGKGIMRAQSPLIKDAELLALVKDNLV